MLSQHKVTIQVPGVKQSFSVSVPINITHITWVQPKTGRQRALLLFIHPSDVLCCVRCQSLGLPQLWGGRFTL